MYFMIHVLQKQSQGSQGLPNVDYGGPTDPEFQAIGICISDTVSNPGEL